MPSARSISLVLLLAAAHVSLVPLSIAALSQPSSTLFWKAAALALAAAQLGLLTVWLNLSTSRLLPACCAVAAVALWGIGLVPLMGFQVFLHSTALLMTQLSILAQLRWLCYPADDPERSNGRGRFHFQFSLKTLMVAALVVCVLLGYPQWLATLRGARLPVLSVTVAAGVLLFVLLAAGVLRGARVLLPAWALLLGLTLFVVGPSVDVRAWWTTTKAGYIAEAGLALISILLVRLAGWPITEFRFAAPLKKGARLVRWFQPTPEPQSAAP
jgi:hypothetical protein